MREEERWDIAEGGIESVQIGSELFGRSRFRNDNETVVHETTTTTVELGEAVQQRVDNSSSRTGYQKEIQQNYMLVHKPTLPRVLLFSNAVM